MDCLDFSNLQSLIYADLARNIGECKDEESIQPAVDLIKSSVDIPSDEETEGKENGYPSERIFMTVSKVSCHVGFAQLATNLPTSQIDSTVPVLLEILREIPIMDFDRTLLWHKWALPDQIVSATVCTLLRLASSFPRHRSSVTSSILEFSSIIIEQLKTEHPNIVLTQYAPSFHGFYRAIISTPFTWSADEWSRLTENMNKLLLPEVVDHLNDLLPQSLQSTQSNPEDARFIQSFLIRYVSQERPLTGYFIVCCVMEIIWTVLAQTLSPPAEGSMDLGPEVLAEEEAVAANEVWERLIRMPIEQQPLSESQEMLRKVAGYAIRCFSDLLQQIEDMDTEPSLDTYAWETMSESLKLASVCSVALQEPMDELLSRLRLLLSEASPISDHMVQEAALKSTTVIVQNFPSLASAMSGHLRRFVTSPLPIFEYEFAAELRAPLPLAAAAKCLSLCIKLAPGDDFIMSNMYSLLNYISATSKEPYESSWSTQVTPLPSVHSQDHAVQSLKTGLQVFNEDQQRLIGITTISVVTCLALEFKLDEVTRLTTSMLLQRLRSAEPTVEAAIVYNLVDLATIAPKTTFIDITRVLSTISRSGNRDDPRFSYNTVVAAQTKLAQELRRRPELRDIYLFELLNLFIDKGVAIQNAVISNHHLKTDDMVDQLGSLLLPIDALLTQSDFNPSENASADAVSLFRNLWFLSVLFQFTNPEERGVPSAEWQIAALTRIAIKTPAIVPEEVPDFVTSSLEYNTIIRKEYAQIAIQQHRSLLLKLVPSHHSEIRYRLPSQIIFLLTMHDLEAMRSAAGYPSSLPLYFVNESVNTHDALSSCMNSVTEKVIQATIGELSKRVVEHSLPKTMSSELRQLLVLCCHRVARVRDIALNYIDRLITSFPSLMCDKPLVFAILEILTMLRRACEGEYTDEYDPVFYFRSEQYGIDLEMSDSYKTRNDILASLHSHSNNWLGLALARAPIELQSTLQKYLVTGRLSTSIQSTELGASVALQFAAAIGPSERKLASISGTSAWRPDRSRKLVSQIACEERCAGGMKNLALHERDRDFDYGQMHPKVKITKALKEVQAKNSSMTVSDMKELLFQCAACLACDKADYDLLHHLVALPFAVFSPLVVTASIEAWTWLVAERPELEIPLMTEINNSWVTTIKKGSGLFCDTMSTSDPFMHPIEYSPTDKSIMDLANVAARKLLSPHVLILQFLFSCFQAARYQKPGLMLLILRLVLCSAREHREMSTHPLAREARFSFLLFGFEALKSSRMDAFCENKLRKALYHTAFSWFAVRPQWSYGANRVQVEADIQILSDFLTILQTDSILGINKLSSTSFVPNMSVAESEMKNANRLLRLLVENEIFRLTVWNNPLSDVKRFVDPYGSLERIMVEGAWINEIRTAWKIDPALVVYLPERFKSIPVENECGRWIRAHTQEVLDYPEALNFVVGKGLSTVIQRDLKFVLLWAPVTPVVAVTYFEPRYSNDPVLLQYAHRVLEQHPVELTFFFVPQIVQALRNDPLGYVKRFIFETAKISQLFCHQIIWNMKANCYKDDAAEKEDPLKPSLDKMTDLVVNSLSGDARTFYDREFSFFNEVTSISGKLRPFIKKSKPEKKAKIDEEMAKIKVEVGVYLPSNPDGIVIDIDRKSGRPLQSHAKAPFMASFKVRKERVVVSQTSENVLDEGAAGKETVEEQDVWQAAIFKVGDDCRQDVLALQVIAMFKNVFTSVGLNLYLFPYRVTATGPGCGVIDVVPNATSRDEMGRAKINDLLGFFTAKYGGEDTISFQRARLNFIQSMAAYSVACYILQIKDRHNGNIMIDGEGHIVHIDFGFLFDIDEYLKFLHYDEFVLTDVSPDVHVRDSFKLNHEMVILMGGRYSRGYTLFQELTIKAFLAIRPHAKQIISTVELMLGTELPSFKGEPTIRRLRDRFALHLNERQAADFMTGIIRNAHENMRSTAYDEFQRLQNGIPYK
ncbi:STT4 [Sanghuangporus vaninii]